MKLAELCTARPRSPRRTRWLQLRQRRLRGSRPPAIRHPLATRRHYKAAWLECCVSSIGCSCRRSMRRIRACYLVHVATLIRGAMQQSCNHIQRKITCIRVSYSCCVVLNWLETAFCAGAWGPPPPLGRTGVLTRVLTSVLASGN